MDVFKVMGQREILFRGVVHATGIRRDNHDRCRAYFYGCHVTYFRGVFRGLRYCVGAGIGDTYDRSTDFKVAVFPVVGDASIFATYDGASTICRGFPDPFL